MQAAADTPSSAAAEPGAAPSPYALRGFWRDNPALVQLLGLCPLLAVTTSVVNGFALGVATAAVLTIATFLVSSLKFAVVPAARWPLFVLIAAALVTCIDLVMHAVRDDLHDSLGIFVPLIVANSLFGAHARAVASREPVGRATLASLATGAGFVLVMVALGALREMLGRGTLLAGMPQLTGGAGAGLALHLPFSGMLAAVLPPGAFFGMALLLALRNAASRKRSPPPSTADAAL
jgi:electron transport complex protein RnfE